MAIDRPGHEANSFADLKQLLDTFENPKDRFEAVWDIVKECGEEERHFNQLQSVYRGVASTWLLATFSAVGYLMYNNTDGHLPEAIITCVLGTIGVGLLCILDVDIYHRLLLSAFNEGEDLERCLPWLPRIRRNMTSYTKKQVRLRLALYYALTASAPLVVGFFIWSQHSVPPLSSYLLVLGASYVIGIFWWTLRKDGKLEEATSVLTAENNPLTCPFGHVYPLCARVAKMM